MNINEIRRFRRVLRRFERITNAQLRDCCAQVTLAQCLVLLEIDESDRLTMGQLASRLRLDNSTLSRTIDGLVTRGLVERGLEDHDRRVVWIRLSDEGAKACAAIHDENDALYGRIFDRIPPAKQKAVVRSFETLVQAFLDAEGDSRSDGCCDSGKPPAHSSKRTRNRRGAQSK